MTIEEYEVKGIKKKEKQEYRVYNEGKLIGVIKRRDRGDYVYGKYKEVMIFVAESLIGAIENVMEINGIKEYGIEIREKRDVDKGNS